jgi:short-subunit dehydrogenase
MPDLAAYGPWAVIAGGSEGVGAEFAQQLAESGINVVLIARKNDPLEETARRCRSLGAEVRTLPMDLLEPTAGARIAAATADLEVGLLIYNAGANTCSQTFLDGDLAEHRKVVDLNVTRMMELVQHFAIPMVARRRGGIMIIGSVSGYFGAAHHAAYAGAKAFSRIFAESLWVELRDSGVKVIEVVLGLTRTPAMQRVGLNFDAPGMLVSEPADVAREALAHLADGPVFVAGGNAEQAEHSSGPDRARVVSAAHDAILSLMNSPAAP